LSANAGVARQARNNAARVVFTVVIVLEVRRASWLEIGDLSRGQAGLGSC
jgi:hypothetical protein